MAQINKGFEYSSTGANSYVTASNLNQHVSLATLAGGAIAEQPANSSTNDTDVLLIGTGGGASPTSIWKQTKAQFTDVINSNTINVNNLSVAEAEFDNLTINGAYDDAVYFDIGNAALYSSASTGGGQITFGYDSATHALPAGGVGNTFVFYGRQATFLDPTSSVDLTIAGSGIDIQVNGNLTVQHTVNVAGGLLNAGKQVVTEIIAAKTGVCAVFGAGILHKTGDFDIPADETWVVTFDASWQTGAGGNTMPDYYYTVKAFAEKATYTDVELGEWKTTYPTQSGVNRINAVLILTQASLANLQKKIKFVAYAQNSTTVVANILNANTTSYYNITLQKTKTSTFTTDSSIL